MNYQYQFFNKNTALNDVVFNAIPCKRVKQTHGNDVVIVRDDFDQNQWLEADGIVTTMVNTPIAVITADCAPVLLYGERHGGVPVIGAAHAGWQGALGGVFENTINVMDCDLNSVRVFIGPCIAHQSFEVSNGFEEPFLSKSTDAAQFFTKKNEEKLLFDLKSYCAWRIRGTGVNNIEISDVDTLINDDYHSHRGGADGTQGERNLSAIMLCD